MVKRSPTPGSAAFLSLLRVSLSVLVFAFAFPGSAEPGKTTADLKVQLDAGEYASVVELADLRISASSASFERYSPELIAVYEIKAEALYELGEYDAAIDALMGASQLLRMNLGLHAIQQLPLLERLAETHHKLGNAIAANSYEEAALELALRTYEGESEALISPLTRLANWYLQAGYYSASRQLFTEAADIATRHLPSTQEAYTQSLAGVADTYIGEAFPNFDRASNSYYSQFVPAGINQDRQFVGKIPVPEVAQASAFAKFRGGERALKKLVGYWREQLEASPAADVAGRAKQQERLVEAMIELGDWHVRFRNPHQALQVFEEARALMVDERAAQEFAEPKLLFMPKLEPLHNCVGTQCVDPTTVAPTRFVSGEVRFNLTINNHGTVQRITRISSTPEDLVLFYHKKQTRLARYRPAVIDGKFADLAEVPVVHRFSYVKDDSPASTSAN